MPLTPDEATEMSSLESQISGYMSKDWLSPEQRASYDSIRSRLDDLQRRASTPQPAPAEQPAPHAPSSPQPPADFPAAPNLGTPVIPTGDDHTAVPPDLSKPVSQAPPVAGQTKYLPLTGNAGYDNTIKQVDAALDKINDTAFKVNPSDLWHHDGAQLGGPNGPSTISALEPVTNGMKDLTSDTADKFNTIASMWDKHGNQNAIARIRDLYKPMMQAASDGVGTGGPATDARNALDQSGNGIRGVFDSFHGAIRSSRDAIDGLYGTDEHGNRYLDTTRSLNLDPSIVSDAQSKLHNLQDTTTKLGTSLDSWNIPTRVTADSAPAMPSGGDTSGDVGAPSGGGGGDGGASGGGDAAPAGDAHAAAPAQPAAQPAAAPPPGGGMPAMPSGMPSMPSMPSIPMGGEHPPAGDTHLSSDDDVPKDGTSALHDGGDAKVKPAVDQSSAAVHASDMAMIPHPGDHVRPGALGADGKPLDKDGDGKMDADAIAPTKENMDRDGDGLPDQFQIPLSADGRTIDVTMTDPRLAEMMTRMAGASDDKPMSILDAAKASGLDLHDYGEKIDTLAIQPGDVVTGTDTGLYAGNGLVLTQDGHLKGLEQVMDFNKSDPAVHRLALPDLPSDSEVVPPTHHDAPAAPVTHDAPAPAPAPAPPVHAAAPPPPAPAPAPAPSPATAPSGGSGLPQEVAFEGHALG